MGLILCVNDIWSWTVKFDRPKSICLLASFSFLFQFCIFSSSQALEGWLLPPNSRSTDHSKLNRGTSE
ncbi:hypothetical protein RchiOBHm_Chr1g0331541 [Rosa chinensis]|uniref:Uncharacterized protein n=1 Tax=Rosa chinensis TaxID=74649 RepID=A0A2P6SBK9_ROSCH|nr:hypothetical protein RchiOBHm_Chr1g0331541 [Rosa chinensis]